MKRWVWILSFVLLAAGCVENVVIPTPEPSIVVKGILMNDATQKVDIYYTGAIDASTYMPVEDAEVVVLSGASGSDGYHYSYAGNGRYVCNYIPEHHRKYQLVIVIPGRDTISAETVFPKKTEISTKFFPPERFIDDGEKVREEKGIIEYNRIFPWDRHVHRNEVEEMKRKGGTSILSQMPGILFQMDSPYPEAMYVVGVNEEDGKLVRASELATNHLYVDQANLNKRRYHSPIVPGQDTSIRLGYDYAFASHYDELLLRDDYLRISAPDTYDNGLGRLYQIVYPRDGAYFTMVDASPLFTVVGDISYNYWWEDERERRSSLYFCAVSQEYDRYLQDCWEQTVSTEGDLLATLYVDASRIYSNVKGGYGVFGAMYVLRHDCDLERIPAGTVIQHYPVPFDYCSAYPAYPAPLPEL